MIATLPLAAGCCDPLATLMASAPNRINLLAGPANPLPPLESFVADRHLWAPVGPPTATLSVSIIEPKGGVPPRGTILVLHGIYARSITMLPQARALAYAGYRVALVDLRGHGRSTGDYLTYGVREARDVSQVIDAIEGQQLIAGRIGVLGISYWNSVVLQQAAPDHSARIPIPHGGHTSLWFDLDGSVSTHAIEWFDRWLGQRLT